MTDTVIHRIVVLDTPTSIWSILGVFATFAAVVTSLILGLKPYRVRLRGIVRYVARPGKVIQGPGNSAKLIMEKFKHTSVTNLGFRECIVESLAWEWRRSLLKPWKKVRWYFFYDLANDTLPKTLPPHGGSISIEESAKFLSTEVRNMVAQTEFAKVNKRSVLSGRLWIRISTGHVYYGRIDKEILRDIVRYRDNIAKDDPNIDLYYPGVPKRATRTKTTKVQGPNSS
jgi:hypothetical protein